jgi:four helix bundle protein
MNVEHPTPDAEQRTHGGADAGGARRPGSARVYDLEERLLRFAAAAIDLSESLPNTRAGNHVAGQLLRSGTSPLGNHGEAESAESRDDFIHKLKVSLKELRECRRWARLIELKRWCADPKLRDFVQAEGEELIRIFVASIRTADHNRRNQADARTK